MEYDEELEEDNIVVELELIGELVDAMLWELFVVIALEVVIGDEVVTKELVVMGVEVELWVDEVGGGVVWDDVVVVDFDEPSARYAPTPITTITTKTTTMMATAAMPKFFLS